MRYMARQAVREIIQN